MLKLKVFRSIEETRTKVSRKRIFSTNAEMNLSKARGIVILTLTEVI